jgi:hypothetical protein
MMIKNPSLGLAQTSNIYEKQCPVCSRYSLKDADECWNCHFKFVEEKKKNQKIFNFGEKVLVSLSIILVFIIALLRYLAV